ncbi:MAG: hypothetical protein ACLT90_19925 [Enterococcus raffinosus]
MKKIISRLTNWLRHFLTGSFYNRKNVWQAFPAFFDAAAEKTYRVPGLKSPNIKSKSRISGLPLHDAAGDDVNGKLSAYLRLLL